MEAEQSINNQEQPVVFGRKRVKMGVGQSDLANNPLGHYCIHRYIRFWPEKHRELQFVTIAPKTISPVQQNTGARVETQSVAAQLALSDDRH